MKVRFVLHITDENDRSKYVQDIEQDVFKYSYDDRGTFVINGAERVIVSQLQRSPGVFLMRHSIQMGQRFLKHE